MKDSKISVKIDRDVYKQLLQVKLDTDSKSVSNTIRDYLNTPVIPIGDCIINGNRADLVMADVHNGSDSPVSEELRTLLTILFDKKEYADDFNNNQNTEMSFKFAINDDWYMLSIKDFYNDVDYMYENLVRTFIVVEDFMKCSIKID
jgi:phosphate uptake regulator